MTAEIRPLESTADLHWSARALELARNGQPTSRKRSDLL